MIKAVNRDLVSGRQVQVLHAVGEIIVKTEGVEVKGALQSVSTHHGNKSFVCRTSVIVAERYSLVKKSGKAEKCVFHRFCVLSDYLNSSRPRREA